MDKMRKRIRICLLCVVMTAVVVGLLYYYSEMQGEGAMNRGTLISNIETGWKNICR